MGIFDDGDKNGVAKALDLRDLGVTDPNFGILGGGSRQETAAAAGLNPFQDQTVVRSDGTVDPIGAATTIGVGWPHRK